MMMVDAEVNRVLTLLRNKIRERGFTQLQVQEALSWGRSYISQLLTKQKSLRVEQVLLILNVIGVPSSSTSTDAVVIERFTVSEDGSELRHELAVTDPLSFVEPAVMSGTWSWVPGIEVSTFECEPG